jgi:L-2-hydroxyglutarate oxidase LhgO
MAVRNFDMTSSFDFDVLIIGAGVVGLAIGRSFARHGREVTVVDRNYAFGMETSSRNSEVIHAGIYYPQGSLKARLCVEGRERLYAFAKERHIPFRKCGKVIVANAASTESGLSKIEAAAIGAGVNDLQWLDKKQAFALEPQVACSSALFSPSTGIIDSHALMLAYLAEIEAGSGCFVGNTNIVRIEPFKQGGFRLWLDGEQEPLTARTVINAGGLWATKVALSIDGLNPEIVPELRYARGVYFTLDSGKAPFEHLVYPLPDRASLGVHATLDLAGQVRFGPDVEWIDDPEDYHVDPARADAFVEAIADYWPAIRQHSLVPAYAGNRPKLCGLGDPPADFRIDGPEDTGIEGLCCLYGIESPGLTSSLAIGEYVADLFSC